MHPSGYVRNRLSRKDVPGVGADDAAANGFPDEVFLAAEPNPLKNPPPPKSPPAGVLVDCAPKANLSLVNIKNCVTTHMHLRHLR